MTEFMSEHRREIYCVYLRELWLAAKKFPKFRSFGSERLDTTIREMWGDWATRDEPYLNPYNRVREPAKPKPTDTAKLSAWAQMVVNFARNTPDFDKCLASHLTDRELAHLIWELWEPMKGTNKKQRIVNILLQQRIG
jgi:hypothetical protein